MSGFPQKANGNAPLEPSRSHFATRYESAHPPHGVDQGSSASAEVAIIASIEAQTTSQLSETRRRALPEERIYKPTARRLRLSDLPRHREVLRVLAMRDFKVKFKQSLLGPLWLLVQPIALLAGLVVALGSVVEPHAGVPYSLFALVALCVWTYFSIAFNMGALALITNTALVRRTPCPRVALPLASLLTNLPALAIPGAAAVLLAAVLGALSPRVILLPLCILWLLVLAGGAVLLFGGLASRYRDLVQAIPFLLQIGVFAAPIGYSLDQVSPTVRALLSLNPITGLIEFWRWSILQPYPFHTDVVLVGLGATVVVVVAAWHLFGRLETTMADFI